MNMLQVIQQGASARRNLPCPFCGETPPLASRIAGRVLVGCENDDCPANPQVAADTLVQARALWNIRRA